MKRIYLALLATILILVLLVPSPVSSRPSASGWELSYFVAASNASESSKRLAKYVADGEDDQVEIQAALDENGFVEISEGTFYPSAPILYSSNVSVLAKGMRRTVFNARDMKEGYVFEPAPHTKRMIFVELGGFEIRNAQKGILWQDVWDGYLHDITIRTIYNGAGLVLDGGDYGVAGTVAERIIINGASQGVVFIVSGNGYVNGNTFYSLVSNANGGWGLNIPGGGISVYQNVFIAPRFEANGKGGVTLGKNSRVQKTEFWHAYFDNNGAAFVNDQYALETILQSNLRDMDVEKVSDSIEVINYFD